jgi:hypothetical protein
MEIAIPVIIRTEAETSIITAADVEATAAEPASRSWTTVEMILITVTFAPQTHAITSHSSQNEGFPST